MSCYRTEMALFQTDLCSNHKPVRSRGLYQWVGRGSTANNGLYLGEGDHSHDQHMFVSPVVTRGMSRIQPPRLRGRGATGVSTIVFHGLLPLPLLCYLIPLQRSDNRGSLSQSHSLGCIVGVGVETIV
jgi:hypothetical protein